ncbi:LPS-assembly lipoprotein LptE [Lacimicrobium alkaliphilum]|uniref:LPS-assembly lipoprotein LptE n=1 Tax=Lacimicrobium alkaliphilum TaxID=1526571 RepID=A0ABQ1RQ67_9ALTE|nr:LPS assembly lipoprotein LptE [Lacimicrobium alkaliphilum]GGD75813.1 LPS-assembly lipoprotein LptE [Lacimicrobium alkaliphilum]
MRRLSVLLISMLLSLVLSSCGFTLRGTDPIGNQFRELHLTGSNPHAPLVRAMKERLERYSVSLLSQPQSSAAVLYLYPEKLDRALLSLFRTGQVAEYELIYQVRYEIQAPGQVPQLFTFDLSREYQDDPNAVLAKSRELNLILDELRKLASERIVRQLSRLSNQAP